MSMAAYSKVVSKMPLSQLRLWDLIWEQHLLVKAAPRVLMAHRISKCVFTNAPLKLI